MNAAAISMMSDIVIGVCALVVAIIAFLGLRTWRKELTGRAKFDVARSVMLLCLKLTAGFEAARNPFTFSTEYASRLRQENESSSVSQVLDEWYARANHLRSLQEDLIEIQEAAWEAEILFEEDSGKEVSEAIRIYRHSYAELSSAISSYFTTRQDEVMKGFVSQHQDWLRNLHKVIYSVGEDDFSKRIEEATTKVRQALRIYVK